MVAVLGNGWYSWLYWEMVANGSTYMYMYSLVCRVMVAVLRMVAELVNGGCVW